MLFQPGTVIDGKYEVMEQLGQGGYGTIVKVKRVGTPDIYALKYCLSIEEEDAKRFEREMDFLEEKFLANVIRVVDSEINHTPPYFVMPLAQGSLETEGGRLFSDEDARLDLFIQICKGVRELHRNNCVHRDIKPTNILIIDDVPYVSDVGIAKFRQHTTVLTQAALGSTEYAPPEQFSAKGSSSADVRADVFALGKLLYWMFCGRSPSHMDLTKIPQGIRPIVEKATSLEVDDRFQAVDSLIEVVTYYKNTRTSWGLQSAQVQRIIDPLEAVFAEAEGQIRQGKIAATAKVRRTMSHIATSILEATAKLSANENEAPDERLVTAIDDSLPVVERFSDLAGEIAQYSAAECAEVVHSEFGSILDLYAPDPTRTGAHSHLDFDLAKFLGHELYVTFISQLMAEEKWEMLGGILNEGIYVRNNQIYPIEDNFAKFGSISEYIELLERRNTRLQLRRVSLHADILQKRHSAGRLGFVSPIADIADADFLLFLRTAILKGDFNAAGNWRPWSCLYMRSGGPKFLVKSFSASYSKKILKAVGVSDIEELRTGVAEYGRKVEAYFQRGGWFSPFATFKNLKLGTL